MKMCISYASLNEGFHSSLPFVINATTTAQSFFIFRRCMFLFSGFLSKSHHQHFCQSRLSRWAPVCVCFHLVTVNGNILDAFACIRRFHWLSIFYLFTYKKGNEKRRLCWMLHRTQYGRILNVICIFMREIFMSFQWIYVFNLLLIDWINDLSGCRIDFSTAESFHFRFNPRWDSQSAIFHDLLKRQRTRRCRARLINRKQQKDYGSVLNQFKGETSPF